MHFWLERPLQLPATLPQGTLISVAAPVFQALSTRWPGGALEV